MNKIIKYITILPILIIGLFIFSNTAKAQVITTYPDITITPNGDSPTGFGGTTYQSVGQVIYPTSDITIRTLKVNLSRTGTVGDSIYAKIWTCASPCNSSSPYYEGTLLGTTNSLTGASLNLNSDGPNYTGGQNYILTFIEPVILSANTRYFFDLYRTGTLDNTNFYYAKTYGATSGINNNLYAPTNCTGTYGQECTWKSKVSNTNWGFNGAYDLLFEISDSSNTNPNAPQGQIITPSNNATLTSQSQAKTINGTCYNTTKVYLLYTSKHTDITRFSPDLDCINNTWSHTFTGDDFFNDEYFLDLNLAPRGITFVNLHRISITISISNNPIPTPQGGGTIGGSPFSSSSNYFIDCSRFDTLSFFSGKALSAMGCYFSKSMMVIAYYLIEPANFSTNAITSSIQNFKTVLPFSIFYTLTDSLQENLESPTAINLTIYIPEPIDHTFIILTPTILEDTLGTETKNLIFTTILTFMWIAILFGILIIMI